MTAKEKALELLKNQEIYVQKRGNDLCGNAKQLAVNTADEVIQALEKLCGDVSVTHYWHPLDYWKEVKSEIEKL
jgi:hypothetical protein